MIHTHTQTLRVVSLTPSGAAVFAQRDGRWRYVRGYRWTIDATDPWERAVALRLAARARGMQFDRGVGVGWLAEATRLHAAGVGVHAIARALGGEPASWARWIGDPERSTAPISTVRAALTLRLPVREYMALRARLPRGVSPGAISVLGVLGGQTLAQLAILTRRHESTTSVYLRQLERGRLAAPHGPRPVRWDPTDAGRALVAELAPTVAERRTA